VQLCNSRYSGCSICGRITNHFQLFSCFLSFLVRQPTDMELLSVVSDTDFWLFAPCSWVLVFGSLLLVLGSNVFYYNFDFQFCIKNLIFLLYLRLVENLIPHHPPLFPLFICRLTDCVLVANIFLPQFTNPQIHTKVYTN